MPQGQQSRQPPALVTQASEPRLLQSATHVERVRAWRQAHPGYWRRTAPKPPDALQENLTPQPSQNQSVDASVPLAALQDDLFRQPAVLVGLISHLTGLALQDDIDTTTRRLQQLGRDISSGSPHQQGGIPMHKRPILPAKLRRPPRQFSWVDQRLVREHLYRSAQPRGLCPLSLFGHRRRCPGLELLRRSLAVPALLHLAVAVTPGAPSPHPAGLGGL